MNKILCITFVSLLVSCDKNPEKISKTRPAKSEPSRVSGELEKSGQKKLMVHEPTQAQDDTLKSRAIFDKIGEMSDVGELTSYFQELKQKDGFKGDIRNSFLESILFKIARIDTKQFVALVNEVDPGWHGESIVKNSFGDLCRIANNPEELLELYKSIEREEFRGAAKGAIFSALISQAKTGEFDSSRFFEIFADDPLKVSDWVRIGEAYEVTDDYEDFLRFEESLASTLDANDIIKFRKLALREASSPVALEILQSIDSKSVAKDPFFYKIQTTSAVSSMVHASPKESLEMFVQLEDFPLKNQIFNAGLNQWLGQDPMKAGEWVGQLSNLEVRDKAVNVLVRHCLAHGAESDAQEWLNIVSNPELREKLEKVVAASNKG